MRNKLISLLDEVYILCSKNKGLCLGFFISFIIVISYKLTEDMPEVIPYGKFIYSLSKDLSLSYMGGFIFYIMQVYLPEKKEKFNIKKGIKSKVLDIIILLDYPNKQVYYLLNNYYIDKEEMNIDLIKDISDKIDLFSEGYSMNNDGEKIPFLEELNINNKKLSNKINSLYKSYGMYIDSELIEILDEVEELLEFNLFNSITEITISRVTGGDFASKNDMYINPKKYINNDSIHKYKFQKRNTFKQYHKLYLKLHEYYMNN
ncbi:hypothetical protein PN290_01545 [Romboutsia sp. 1001216sp1]|uniref:hypothetical protein n=1 Tax=Romboutsia sp. 1001216sp1 TaxID=2986997 RepID=UPI0018A9EFE3|nr:hypothetical protein [Romboutsia sp. 1001216sp1]MDB8794618.1 hypothetical protein [Romboutsia sp. 1001216sp1]MDB8798050.1 hypothetical protein [Romboutsia sp. 1001216sp1]